MLHNLITARKEQQLTQVELAKMLDVTERHYKSLESGDSDGSVKVWKKLKTITGKSIDYLLQQADDSTKAPHDDEAEKISTTTE